MYIRTEGSSRGRIFSQILAYKQSCITTYNTSIDKQEVRFYLQLEGANMGTSCANLVMEYPRRVAPCSVSHPMAIVVKKPQQN
jgi:hypothetical protein